MRMQNFVSSQVTLALCAALLAAGSNAQDKLKDVPAGDPWSHIDASTRARMLRQEPLSRAASEIRSEVQKDWSTVLDGSGGFASVKLMDDRVIVRWKGEVPASVQEAIGRARQAAPVEIEAAAYSHAELSTAAGRLSDFVETTSKDGYPYLGVLMYDDRLRVVVAAGADAVSAQANLPSVDLPVEIVEGEPMQLNSRLNDWAPWYGGARFESWRGNDYRTFCTLGFGVTDGYREYLLTAAHCATRPDNIFDPTGEFIGGASAKEDWDKDILLIDYTNAGGGIYVGGVGSNEGTRMVATWDYAHPLEYLCTSGSVSGQRCDFRVEATGRTMYGCDSDGDCYWMHGLVLASRNMVGSGQQDGDSGGPVYAIRSDGRVTAKGTITGSFPGGMLWFAPISTAVNQYRVAPLTSNL